MNQLAEQTVVERATGGKGGGGAQLTHYGQRLIQLYDLLGGAAKAFDVLQQDDLPLDSLLAAISRFSLQTSARNQFFGTVIERDHQQVQQHGDFVERRHHSPDGGRHPTKRRPSAADAG